MAAGTFTGVLAAIFLGIFPTISTVVRSVFAGLLTLGAQYVQDLIHRWELLNVEPGIEVVLAQSAVVGIVVLGVTAVMGASRRFGLLGQLTGGLVAGFVATLTLVATFAALPQEKLLDMTLVPMAIALMGVSIVLGSALERADARQ